MKLDIVSDLHVTHIKDHGARFFGELVPETGASALIIAGDVAEFHWWGVSKDHIETACGNYENVLFVAGNHDYYGTTFQEGDARFRDLENQIENFHFLEKDVLTLDGVKIAGCSLWFKQDPMNETYEKLMSDFALIQEFKPGVYERNVESQEFLKQLPADIDIVVTHHLVSPRSVHAQYQNDPANRYFLCDVSDTILDLRPKFSIHGHTHFPCDYQIGETQVICHPKGYPRERHFSENGYKPITIEV